MNRREAIERTALLLGYALSAPTIAAVMQGCKASPELAYKPVFFTEPQAVTIAEMAEIIIPKTDTPGAKDVGVPSFIDSLLNDIYTKEEKDNFIAGLTAFDDDARKTYGATFGELSANDKVAHFKKHHDEAVSKAGGPGVSGWWNASKGADKPFVLKVKELTLLGFFTSEAGATQVTQYNQVPGPFKGCVPLTEVGRAWAT